MERQEVNKKQHENNNYKKEVRPSERDFAQHGWAHNDARDDYDWWQWHGHEQQHYEEELQKQQHYEEDLQKQQHYEEELQKQQH